MVQVRVSAFVVSRRLSATQTAVIKSTRSRPTAHGVSVMWGPSLTLWQENFLSKDWGYYGSTT